MTRLIVLTTLLAACGGKKAADSTPEAPPPEEPPEQTATDAPEAAPEEVPEQVTPTVAAPTDPTLDLLGKKWELVTFRGAPVELPEGHQAIFFQVDPGTPPNLTGYAGCNRFYGTAFSATETEIHFGTVGSTRRACPTLAIEQRFLGSFYEAKTYAMVDGMLVISGTDETLFTFRQGEAEAVEVTE